MKKQEEIQQALEVTKEETEKEKEKSEKARMEWERERGAMKEEISELRDNMRENCEMLRKMEGNHKVHAGHATSCLGLFPFLPPKCAEFQLKIHMRKGIYNRFSSLHNTERM